jgi:hypothetical protein
MVSPACGSVNGELNKQQFWEELQSRDRVFPGAEEQNLNVLHMGNRSSAR